MPDPFRSRVFLMILDQGTFLIGSNDHRPRGYFLIQNRCDFDAAREFYARRIAAQQTNLHHLDALLAQSNI
jgi:hypothetical protein